MPEPDPPRSDADTVGETESKQPPTYVIKVGIIEANDSVRAGLAALIRFSPDLVLAGVFPDAEAAYREIGTIPPDVVLMDIHLPGQRGIECVREIKRRLPQTQVIMLTNAENSQLAIDSIEAGASGYLLKNSTPERLLEAIRDVHRGGAAISSSIARALVQRFQSQGKLPRIDESLIQKEEEILRYLSQGYRVKEIGELLGISVYTVQGHIRNIYEKLHVRPRAQAIAKLTLVGGPQGSSPGAEPNPMQSQPSDFVRFSAFLPGRVRLAGTILIEVWAYLEAQREDVLTRAMRRRPGEEMAGTGPVEEGGRAGPVKVRRNSPIAFHLILPGFKVAQAQQTIWWTGTPASVGFAVLAPSWSESKSQNGWVEVRRKGVPIATIYFEVILAEVSDLTPKESPAQHVRSIFASYASEDRPEVLLWARGAMEVGVEVFVDALQLRQGQNWEQELQRQVPSKDRFCLFWSAPASQSDWVEREWRCALEMRGIDYIHPVPFADPRDVPPPKELAGSKHFNDIMRVMYDYERSRRK